MVMWCLNEQMCQYVNHLYAMCCCSNSAKESQLSSDGEKPGVGSTTASTGPTYYSNLDYDDPRRALASERGVDLLPDPSRPADKSVGVDSEPGAAVPVPLRVTKKRRSTQPRGDASASDVSVGSADLAPGMIRGPDPAAGGPPTYANLSYERDTPQEQRRDKADKDREGKRRRQKPDKADPIRDPVMRNIAAQQQLRVHIKAQPGTAVHITPSATPPTRPGQDQAPAYHARPPTTSGQPRGYQVRPSGQAGRAFSSGGESETEIWRSLLFWTTRWVNMDQFWVYIPLILITQ